MWQGWKDVYPPAEAGFGEAELTDCVDFLVAANANANVASHRSSMIQ